MAKGIGIKAPRKKARLAPIVKNKKNVYDFENWENWSGADYHKRVRDYKADLYANFKASDLLPDVLAWMKENDYAQADINAVKKRGTQVTVGYVCKLLRLGMPDLNPKHAQHWDSLPGTSGELKPVTAWLKPQLERIIEEGNAIVAEVQEDAASKKNVYVPTIQERIRDQALLQSEAIDEWLDGWFTDRKNFDPKGFDFKKHFQKQGVTQAHARKIRSFFESEIADFKDLERMPTAGQLKKMSEFEQDQWAQLKEGYAHLKKAEIKMFVSAIEELLSAIDFVIDTAKATRAPRKAKPKSADKLVEKLKYAKTDDKYKLASINPVDIISANELWVFNSKTRKLGKYVAKNIDPKGMGRAGSGLQVKGTTIIGFDEAQSIQKTLRKPEAQLKEFKGAGKVALRKFLDDIQTTDTKLNGRCNPDTILLKVT
jgi:hypothetical protein